MHSALQVGNVFLFNVYKGFFIIVALVTILTYFYFVFNVYISVARFTSYCMLLVNTALPRRI